MKSQFAEADAPETKPAENEVPAGEVEGAEESAVVGGEGEGAAEAAPEGDDEGESDGSDESDASDAGEGDEPEVEGAAPEVSPELLAEIEAWESDAGIPMPAKLQKAFNSRIGKLVGKVKEQEAAHEAATAQVAELQAEVEQLRTGAPVAAVPGMSLMDEKQLTSLEAAGRKFVSDAENFLDDTANDEERARVEKHMAEHGLDEKGLKRQLREFRDELARTIPAERQRLQVFKETEAATEPRVKKYFAFLDDRKHPDYALAQEALREVPFLPKYTPRHRMVIGTFVLGLRELKRLDAEEAARTKGQPAAGAVKRPITKAPPRIATGGAAIAAPRTNGGSAREDAARGKFAKALTAQSAQELLEAGLR